MSKLYVRLAGMIMLLALIARVATQVEASPGALDGRAVQGDWTDISALRPVTTDYFQYLSRAGNIRILTTYAPHSTWRKDWATGTYGKVNPATIYIANLYGAPHVRVWLYDPPPSLEGCRAPLKQGPMDADGNIPVNDACYFIRYAIFRTRPVLDLFDTLQQPELRALWLYGLNSHGGVARFARELEALGLNPATGVPYEYGDPQMNLDLNELLRQASQEAREFAQPFGGFPDQERLPQYQGFEPFPALPADAISWAVAPPTSYGWIIPVVIVLVGAVLLARQRVLAGSESLSAVGKLPPPPAARGRR